MCKKVSKIYAIILVIAISSFFTVFSAHTRDFDYITVYVSITPQKYFVESIGGELVKTTTVFAFSEDSLLDHYEYSTKMLIEISKADIYFTIGVPFERVLEDTKSSAILRSLRVHRMVEEESDSGYENHVWIGQEASMQMAKNTYDVLRSYYVGNKEEENYLKERYDALIYHLREVHNALDKKMHAYEGYTIITDHEMLNEFLKDYGIESIAIETHGVLRGGKTLSEIFVAVEKGTVVRSIFIQKGNHSKAPREIAKKIQGSVYFVNILYSNYELGMHALADILVHGMQEGERSE